MVRAGLFRSGHALDLTNAMEIASQTDRFRTHRRFPDDRFA